MPSYRTPLLRSRSYTGPALREIAFPLGGIGTGTVSLGGRGELRDWECRPGNDRPVTRILERQLLPPFIADGGLSPSGVAGLPRLTEATFTGTYPIAQIAFHDDDLPLRVTLEAFNPFSPFDARTSGMPVAVFLWRLENMSETPVDATLVYSQLNPIG